MIDRVRLDHLRRALERASLHLDNHGIRPLGTKARTAYSIVGLEDLKDRAHVEAAALHNLRQMDVENADPLGKIVVLAGGRYVYEVLADFDEVFASVNDGEPLVVTDVGGGRARVEALELVMSSPYPGWYEALPYDRQEAWVDADREFARTFFPPEAILSEVLHLDEASAQLHVIGVPLAATIRKGKENSDPPRVLWKLDKRSYRGATKMAGLRALQDAYHRHMWKRGFELERGEPVEKSKAKRQTADDLRRLRSASEESIAAAREIVDIGVSLLEAVKASETAAALNAAEDKRLKGRADELEARSLELSDQARAIVDEAQHKAAAIEKAAEADAAKKLAELDARIAEETRRRVDAELERLLALAEEARATTDDERAVRDVDVQAALKVVVVETERLVSAAAPDGHRYAPYAQAALDTLKAAAGIVAAPAPETYFERLARLRAEGRIPPLAPAKPPVPEKSPQQRHAELAKAAKRRQDEEWSRGRSIGPESS